MRSETGAAPRAVLLAAGAAVVLALGIPGAALAATTSGTVGGERLASRGLVVDAPGATALPKVGAAAWVLADLDTGEVLAARDPHGRYRPASTMKILTALALLPQLQPEATYVAQWEDANVVGSKVGIVPEATYSVHNLFEALFLVSGNDAAWALSNAGGGVEETVARMNSVARDLGALDTRAVNPGGLDAPGQLTSAYDLAVLTRAAMARDDFRAYASTVKSRFPGKMPKRGKARTSFEIHTQDRLLLNYRGAIGVKTGWTTKARGTFVGAATRGGRTLVATILRTEGDGWREAAALMTWGFRNASLARSVGTLDAVPATPAADVDAADGPGAPARTAEAPAAAGGAGGGLPWWLEVPIVLGTVVLLLRARVLLKRRLRRAARGRAGLRQLPHPRDRRRATSVAASAPRAAAPSVRVHRPPPPLGAEADGPSASSASRGTAS